MSDIRRLAKEYTTLSYSEVARLLVSRIHEERMLALIILTLIYARGDKKERTRVFDMYIRHTAHINNWDLVDASAYKILGAYMNEHPNEKKRLIRLAGSENMWERRMAIVATFAFLARGESTDTLLVAKMLLGDTHDLIRTAVGWALREVGKKDEHALKSFIRAHYDDMHRTTLRYAIERFSPEERTTYLRGFKSKSLV
jgi:3-methyladenine DNA glycosylase AlkD